MSGPYRSADVPTKSAAPRDWWTLAARAWLVCLAVSACGGAAYGLYVAPSDVREGAGWTVVTGAVLVATLWSVFRVIDASAIQASAERVTPADDGDEDDGWDDDGDDE